LTDGKGSDCTDWAAIRPRLEGPARAAAIGALAALAVACAPQPALDMAASETALGETDVPAGTASGSKGPGAPDLTSIPGSYLAGLHAQRVGESGRAADFLMHALEQDPDNADLLRRTFILLLGEGREREAFELARRLTERMPEAMLPNIALVVADVQAGRYGEAEARLRALPETGLNKFFAPLMLAWTLVGKDSPDEALRALDPLAGSSGFAVLRDLHAGLINDLAGRIEAAEEGYRGVQASGQGTSLRLVELLGSLYERTGRPVEARALYDEYLAQNPESVLLEQALDGLESGKAAEPVVRNAAEGMAEALFNLASTLHQESVGQVGLTYGRLALALRPDFPVCQALLANILDGLGRGSDSAAVYESIRADSPFRWLARMRVAINLDAQGKTDEALDLLRAMADDRPERTEALVAMGDILRSHERFADAVVAYSRAVERIETFDERHWSLLYSRGIVLERTGQWQRAETDLLRALELRPDQPYVLNYLGYSWVEKGVNLEKARRMLERAVELRPNDGFIVDSLGWVLFRVGLVEEAVAQLENAVELESQDATINDHLGDAYWKVGRENEARFQWRRALSLKPDPEVIAEIQAKLERTTEVSRADEPGR
jgi:tetratricopeptide (TPR) repeat protein